MIAPVHHFDTVDFDRDTQRMIRVSEGDRQAFDDLVRDNFDSTVRIIASMMGSSSQAEDLAQDVFMRVYLSRKRYVPSAKFATWLGTITRNVALNAKRSLARRRVFVATIQDDMNPGEHVVLSPCHEIDLAEVLDSRDANERVHEAISTLPIRQQTAIDLVDFKGLSYEGAAKVMCTTRKAVKSLLGRGRKSLIETLQEDLQPTGGSHPKDTTAITANKMLVPS